jgi:hypothetical protein
VLAVLELLLIPQHPVLLAITLYSVLLLQMVVVLVLGITRPVAMVVPGVERVVLQTLATPKTAALVTRHLLLRLKAVTAVTLLILAVQIQALAVAALAL